MNRHGGGPGGSSRRYHCPKNRVLSHYVERLADRGLSKTPRMPSLASLRSRQAGTEWLAVHPWIAAHLAEGQGDAGTPVLLDIVPV